jgi:hypothetical protein
LAAADLDHVDDAFQAVHAAGEAEGAAPLAGAGFGGEAGDAGGFVVVGLGDGGVGFVAAGGADAFVFVVDFGGGVEGFFEFVGADEGGGPPDTVFFDDFVGDVDPAFLGNFLVDELHGEDGGKVGGGDGLFGGRMERRGQLCGHVGLNVVPAPGDVPFVEEYFFVVVHDCNPFLFGKIKTPRPDRDEGLLAVPPCLAAE